MSAARRGGMMARRSLQRLEVGVFLTLTVVVAGSYVSWYQPGRPVLKVWSCGGNYESLAHFNRLFEARYRCRVSYTAAPVQYLLALAAHQDVGIDILVGRGGPGWRTLRELGQILEGPTYFAVDPYVIAVRRGNPARIRRVEDLGRPGVRVASAPWAMNPKGEVVSELVRTADAECPGLYERWRANTVVALKCGRELVTAVAEGRADAAVTSRSTLTLEAARGRVDCVPIAPRHMLAMRTGRGAVPQCIAVLKARRNPSLARRFRDEVLGPMGRRVFEEHGYFHIASAAARPYRPLMQPAKRATRLRLHGAMRDSPVGGSAADETAPLSVGSLRDLPRRSGGPSPATCRGWGMAHAQERCDRRSGRRAEAGEGVGRRLAAKEGG